MKPVIAFDFDGTLLLSNGKPNKLLCGMVRQYAAVGAKVMICTSRDQEHEDPEWIKENEPTRIRVVDFVQQNELPISAALFTAHEPKVDTLMLVQGLVAFFDNDVEEIVAVRSLPGVQVHWLPGDLIPKVEMHPFSAGKAAKMKAINTALNLIVKKPVGTVEQGLLCYLLYGSMCDVIATILQKTGGTEEEYKYYGTMMELFRNNVLLKLEERENAKD